MEINGGLLELFALIDKMQYLLIRYQRLKIITASYGFCNESLSVTTHGVLLNVCVCVESLVMD